MNPLATLAAAADEDWKLDAACRDTTPQEWGRFFPNAAGRRARTLALQTVAKFCAGCPVAAICRAENPTDLGVWGGEYRAALAGGRDVTVHDLLADPPTITTRKARR